MLVKEKKEKNTVALMADRGGEGGLECRGGFDLRVDNGSVVILQRALRRLTG